MQQVDELLLEVKTLLNVIQVNQDRFKDHIANIESGVNTNRRQVEQLVAIQKEHKVIFQEHQQMFEKLNKIIELLEEDK